ncbi:MAG: ATP-dependent helicase [Deltaproteobacteria bacterium]|nr:ATP-dependent helicase [Deltaproteobacteria bacterium]
MSALPSAAPIVAPGSPEDQLPGPLAGLNAAQRAAVLHEIGPLLIIAGAGTGKTQTLACRVAELLRRGADPRRVLLLTFTRRAAVEMSRRAVRLVHQQARAQSAKAGALAINGLPWSGTFHAIANKLLRMHAPALGLDPSFTILDREDAASQIDLLRTELGLSRVDRRFPRKGTCLAIYSRTVNTQTSLQDNLEQAFPWCSEWEQPLRQLFASYVRSKFERRLLDYDDLLLYWFHLMNHPPSAQTIEALFDHILVDEYQDTNNLQAAIVHKLSPQGRGVTVVGDDAQSIYAFRAASVRNILDFAKQYTPPATVLTLEQNYRSTQPILDATNAVIALSPERFSKQLFSTRASADKPRMVTVSDEMEQVHYVVSQVLAQREAGVRLQQQAVLFRASHHSDALEIELGRRNIPFVKFGGLRFLESAHVKDAVCCLRWAENARDAIAGTRVLQLLPGIGPHVAKRVWTHIAACNFAVAKALACHQPPVSAQEDWPALADLMSQLCSTPWAGQMALVRKWYEPHLERLYDNARARLGDLEQLEQIAAATPSRERFLSDLALDPPQATGAEAGPPHLDEDFLILSTIHSSKGQEWDTVFLLNAADGCIPSDLATGDPQQIEEERRLLYVGMTRAKNRLDVIHPLRFFIRQQSRYGDKHVFTPRSRFLPTEVLRFFACESPTPAYAAVPAANTQAASPPVDMVAALSAMWQ